MSSTRTISLIALFSSLVVASDYALTPVLNVKLVDTLVFSSSYAFGFRIGSSVAIISTLIWSFLSPFGFAGYITPFLIAGELLFAVAGFLSAKIWGDPRSLPKFSLKNSFFGAIMAICAFVWDFETNIGTGLIVGARNLPSLMVFQFSGIPFMVPHEISDFILGSLLAPVAILYFARVFGTLRSKAVLEIPQNRA